ncbi:hypothetical protein ACF1AX_31390 [Streptomyces sp. NPDC014802]|uniref:hypothetical protein n=1 Tax=Streptomyces sp. NPDC014802 TaxID=3364917 RepID=UPI0036FC82A1
MSSDLKNVLDTARRQAIRDELRRITGRYLSEVRITRVRWDNGQRWVALALTVDPQPPFGHREIPLSDGKKHKKIAVLLRDAFPHANWAVAQDYDVTTGVLTEHIVRVPACLGGDER